MDLCLVTKEKPKNNVDYYQYIISAIINRFRILCSEGTLHYFAKFSFKPVLQCLRLEIFSVNKIF